MTDKRTLNSLERIKRLVEEKQYTIAFKSSKTLLDKLVLASHENIFKKKLTQKPAFPVRQVERIITFSKSRPELKKITDKKVFKQTLKWYDKHQEIMNTDSVGASKNPHKFAKKTVHLLTLLHHTSLKIKSYFKD